MEKEIIVSPQDIRNLATDIVKFMYGDSVEDYYCDEEEAIDNIIYGIEYEPETVIEDLKEFTGSDEYIKRVKETRASEKEDTKPVLFVIRDASGRQLSIPNPNDSELWDRVAAMEARGKRGLKVAAYVAESVEPVNEELTTEQESTIEAAKDMIDELEDLLRSSKIKLSFIREQFRKVGIHSADIDPYFTNYLDSFIDDENDMSCVELRNRIEEFIEENKSEEIEESVNNDVTIVNDYYCIDTGIDYEDSLSRDEVIEKGRKAVNDSDIEYIYITHTTVYSDGTKDYTEVVDASRLEHDEPWTILLDTLSIFDNTSDTKHDAKLTEGTGADTAHLAKDIFTIAAKDDKNTWAKTAVEIVDKVPDNLADELFDVVKAKTSDVKVTDAQKQKVVNNSNGQIKAEDVEDCDTFGNLFALFDSAELAKKDPGLLKTLIITVLGIIAVIEPTPIVEIITMIVNFLPAESLAKVVNVINTLTPKGILSTLTSFKPSNESIEDDADPNNDKLSPVEESLDSITAKAEERRKHSDADIIFFAFRHKGGELIELEPEELSEEEFKERKNKIVASFNNYDTGEEAQERDFQFYKLYNNRKNESMFGKLYTVTVKCNDEPEMTIRTIADTDEKAIKYAKSMYASSNTIYADDRQNDWKVEVRNVVNEDYMEDSTYEIVPKLGERITPDEIVKFEEKVKAKYPNIISDITEEEPAEYDGYTRYNCWLKFPYYSVDSNGGFFTFFGQNDFYHWMSDKNLLMFTEEDILEGEPENPHQYSEFVNFADSTDADREIIKEKALEILKSSLATVDQEDKLEEKFVESEECAWCGHFFKPDELEETDWGMICPQCKVDTDFGSQADEIDDNMEESFEDEWNDRIMKQAHADKDETSDKKYNIGSNKVVEIGGPEYIRLEELARMLEEKSPNGFRYRVEKTYEDFGAGMQWYTIICYNRKGESWQTMNTKQWLDLANEDKSVEETYNDMINGDFWQDKVRDAKDIVEMDDALRYFDSLED